MQETFHPAVDAKTFGKMLDISPDLARAYMAAHPRHIRIGKGKIHQTFRLPYAVAVALATGKEPLPALEKPKKSREKKAGPKQPKAPKDAPRAANGCLYGAYRRTKEV